jgi:hypothetical protein
MPYTAIDGHRKVIREGVETAARDSSEPYERALMLSMIAEHVTDAEAGPLLEEILERAEAIEDGIHSPPGISARAVQGQCRSPKGGERSGVIPYGRS